MKLIKRTDDPAEIKRLVHVANKVCAVPEAQQLMDLGGQQGCKLFFDPDLPPGWDGAYTASLNILRLNPASSDSKLIITLAHEVRHLWQNSIVRFTDEQRKSMTPEAALILTFVQEGDAMAFEHYFTEAFNNQGNLTFSYDQSLWLKTFLDVQEQTSASYRQRVIDFCDGSNTISVKNVLDDFGMKKILCRGLDLNDSYWPSDMNLEKTVLNTK